MADKMSSVGNRTTLMNNVISDKCRVTTMDDNRSMKKSDDMNVVNGAMLQQSNGGDICKSIIRNKATIRNGCEINTNDNMPAFRTEITDVTAAANHFYQDPARTPVHETLNAVFDDSVDWRVKVNEGRDNDYKQKKRTLSLDDVNFSEEVLCQQMRTNYTLTMHRIYAQGQCQGQRPETQNGKGRDRLRLNQIESTTCKHAHRDGVKYDKNKCLRRIFKMRNRNHHSYYL